MPVELKINAFAKKAGLPTATIRFYDIIGLVKCKPRRGKTTTRVYDASQLEEVRCVRKLREMGFTLDELLKVRRNKKSVLMRMLGRKLAVQVDVFRLAVHQISMLRKAIENKGRV